jgi:hypothetical protein
MAATILASSSGERAAAMVTAAPAAAGETVGAGDTAPAAADDANLAVENTRRLLAGLSRG